MADRRQAEQDRSDNLLAGGAGAFRLRDMEGNAGVLPRRRQHGEIGDRWFLYRIATHILAFEGDSHVEWFEGNFAEYEEDKKRRLGIDSTIPKRIQYKKFSR